MKDLRDIVRKYLKEDKFMFNDIGIKVNYEGGK